MEAIPSKPSNFSENSNQSSCVNDKILLQPFNYILEIPGKEIRRKLIKAFNHWLNVPIAVCGQTGEIVQMLHNASLLLDDIEDSSIFRRGKPVSHSVFSVASTINSATYVYCLSLQRVHMLSHPKATTIFTEQLLELHRGQGMDIYWRDNYICPTEEQYKEMAVRKTGGLFQLAVRLMQLFSENKMDFKPLICTLGLYFQVRDDYLNLQSDELTDRSSFCEDLTEGKFSFPIIHTIQNHPEALQIMNILRQRTRDVELKKYVLSLMEKIGSFAYTRNYLQTLEKRAKDEINALGSNPLLFSILDELHTW